MASATCTPVPDCKRKIRYATPEVGLPDTAVNPAWSPDGRRFAYCAFADRGLDEPELGIITTIRYDGRHPQHVLGGELSAFRPDWTARS